jgi:hypothetical protein
MTSRVRSVLLSSTGNLVDVFPIEIQNSGDERTHVHLLVVAGDYYGDGAAKGFVGEQGDPPRLLSARRLLRV